MQLYKQNWKAGLVWIDIINIGLILVSDVALQIFFRNCINQNASGAILFKRSGIKKILKDISTLSSQILFKLIFSRSFNLTKKKFKTLDRSKITRSVLTMRCSSTKNIENMNRTWSTQFALDWFLSEILALRKIWEPASIKNLLNEIYLGKLDLQRSLKIRIRMAWHKNNGLIQLEMRHFKTV